MPDQANALLAAWRAGNGDAEKLARRPHPYFFDDKIAWLTHFGRSIVAERQLWVIKQITRDLKYCATNST